jgi:hypothetical protein
MAQPLVRKGPGKHRLGEPAFLFGGRIRNEKNTIKFGKITTIIIAF